MATELIGNIKGIQGETGVTPQIGIGTVTTLPTGEAARATITGTVDYPLLNLGLPRGAKGDTGEVTTEQMDEAIATAEATVRPISAGGTGTSQRRIDISSDFTKHSNVTGVNISAYYYPYEKRCYIRLFCNSNTSFSGGTAGNEYVIGTFNTYKPDAIHVLSPRVYIPVNYAAINATGEIRLKTAPNNSFGSGIDIFITGWWFYDA